MCITSVFLLKREEPLVCVLCDELLLFPACMVIDDVDRGLDKWNLSLII